MQRTEGYLILRSVRNPDASARIADQNVSPQTSPGGLPAKVISLAHGSQIGLPRVHLVHR